MANINGYFQIILKDNKTYLRLFPASEGGEPIQLKELQEYLAFNKIVPENQDWMKAATTCTSQQDVFLCNIDGFSINEYFKLMFTPDKMMAIGRFYPPSTGGTETNVAEIINDLKHKGVVVEAETSVIDAFIKNRQYCYNYVLAKGVPTVEGTNSKIEYFFNTDPNTKPALNPDGSVDFFKLETISKCTKGQLLAKLTPAVMGKKGTRVTGETVIPRDVKNEKLRFANNIELSEDGLSIFAKVDGHVSLVDDKVFVSDIYEVVDVGPATGNIDYVGNVLVKGNVQTGYKVKAQGNVEVRGVVEGAEIDATGKVTIAKGFNGMGRGVINAGESVVVRFIENATVVAGGNVTCEAIMHSNVTTAGSVDVTGKRGFIVGGSVKAQGSVTAKTLGSEMGGDTTINVGVDPKLKNRSQELEGEIKKCKDNMEKITPILATLTKKIKDKTPLTMDQTRYFKQLSAEYTEEKARFIKLNEEYDEVVMEMDNMPTDSSIVILGNIYPGAFLTINEVSKRITTLCARSRFVRDGADIRIKPI